jgi:5-methylcytosine-specific restriction protein A
MLPSRPLPKRLPHYCEHYPCPNTVSEGPYCAEHQAPARHYQRRHYSTTPGVNYGRKWGMARLRFLAEHPYCVDCGSAIHLEVDHDTPHEGDAELFWDQSNWRTRCKPCHSAKTQRETAHRR